MSAIDITPVTPTGANLIRSYGNDGFRVGTDPHRPGSVIVLADRVVGWTPPSVDAVSINDLQAIVQWAAEIDILVIGCGATFTAPSKVLREGMRNHDIVVEWMDTGAACRTFNVLLTEGRQVAAALVAVD
jgi:uncharacterized protein